jgi:hypothetical protein
LFAACDNRNSRASLDENVSKRSAKTGGTTGYDCSFSTPVTHASSIARIVVTAV